jgi:hypothetical protein
VRSSRCFPQGIGEPRPSPRSPRRGTIVVDAQQRLPHGPGVLVVPEEDRRPSTGTAVVPQLFHGADGGRGDRCTCIRHAPVVVSTAPVGLPVQASAVTIGSWRVHGWAAVPGFPPDRVQPVPPSTFETVTAKMKMMRETVKSGDPGSLSRRRARSVTGGHSESVTSNARAVSVERGAVAVAAAPGPLVDDPVQVCYPCRPCCGQGPGVRGACSRPPYRTVSRSGSWRTTSERCDEYVPISELVAA